MTSSGARVAVLACGALARETRTVVERRGWRADVHGVSSRLHLEPARIAPAVDARLARLSSRYDRVVVVYGDCGTGGRLDQVIARHPAARPAGVHCYQWFAAEGWAELSQDVSAYFLTDWLVRSWDAAVVRGLGLDRFPWLRETYFGHIERVVYLRQDPDRDRALERRAHEIARTIDAPLEIRDAGLDALESVLAPLLEDAGVRA